MKDIELASIISAQAPRMEEKRFKELKEIIKKYINENNKNNKYFTLMGMPSKNGNSTRYVTIFNINKNNDSNIESIFSFLVENEKYLGNLKGFLFNEKENYIEIWYGEECYLFFNYTTGVIEIGY